MTYKTQFRITCCTIQLSCLCGLDTSVLPWFHYLNTWGFQASYTVACSSVRLNQMFLHNSTQVLCVWQENYRNDAAFSPCPSGGRPLFSGPWHRSSWPRWSLTGCSSVKLLFSTSLLSFVWWSILKLCKDPPVPYQTSVYLFVYLYEWINGFLFRGLQSLFILMHKLSQLWPVGIWFLCLLFFFTCSHHSLSSF